MTPRLSIIIPVYNAEKYLRDTLNNVTEQRRFNECELLLINDGSKDNSLEILREYQSRFDNVHVIDKPNEGVSATRNRGIDEATGEYLYFMDADDLLHPQAISIVLNEIVANNADIVTWNFTTFYSKTKFAQISAIEFENIDNSDRRAFNYLTEKGCAVSLCSKAIRRSLFANPIIRLIPGMTYGEDMFVSWKCIIKAKSIRYLEPPLYYYRQTGNSAVSQFHANLYETYRYAFDDLKDFLHDNGLGTDDLMKDLDCHFARRIPALTSMESKAPYDRNQQQIHLTKVLEDEYISRALNTDERLKGVIYDLARNKDVGKMLSQVRREALKSRLLFPLKRFLK